eukprot:845557_1
MCRTDMVATKTGYGATLERADSQKDRHTSKSDMDVPMASYQTETNSNAVSGANVGAARKNTIRDPLEVEGSGSGRGSSQLREEEALRDDKNENGMEFSNENNNGERDDGRENNGDDSDSSST